MLDLATHRPNRASSEAKEHGKSNANNADLSTSWRASGTSPGEWWMLDLEGIKYPKRIELEFDTKGAYPLTIAIIMKILMPSRSFSNRILADT